MEYFKLFHLTTARPLAPAITPNSAVCPFCFSRNSEQRSHTHTLVGASSNHHWLSKICLDCGKDYVVEYKGENVWITADNHVLFGMPSCFENYIYPCKCGGEVKRKHTDKEGKPVEGLMFTFDETGMVKHFRTFFYCISCGSSVETDDEHYILGKHYPL